MFFQIFRLALPFFLTDLSNAFLLFSPFWQGNKIMPKNHRRARHNMRKQNAFNSKKMRHGMLSVNIKRYATVLTSFLKSTVTNIKAIFIRLIILTTIQLFFSAISALNAFCFLILCLAQDILSIHSAICPSRKHILSLTRFFLQIRKAKGVFEHFYSFYQEYRMRYPVLCQAENNKKP